MNEISQKKVYENIKEAVALNKDLVPYPFSIILESAGFDAFTEFCDAIRGSTLYISTPQKIFENCIYAEIFKNFDGSNYGQLGRMYGLSERTVRKIINCR